MGGRRLQMDRGVDPPGGGGGGVWGGGGGGGGMSFTGMFTTVQPPRSGKKSPLANFHGSAPLLGMGIGLFFTRETLDGAERKWGGRDRAIHRKERGQS